MKLLKNIKRIKAVIAKSANTTGKTINRFGDTCILGGLLMDCGFTTEQLNGMSFVPEGFTALAKDMLMKHFNIDEERASWLMHINDSTNHPDPTTAVELRRNILNQYVDSHAQKEDCVSETKPVASKSEECQAMSVACV